MLVSLGVPILYDGVDMTILFFDVLHKDEIPLVKRSLKSAGNFSKIVAISEIPIEGVETFPRKNVGALVNELLRETVVFATPGVIFTPEFLEKVEKYKGSLVYSDYLESGKEQKKLFDYNGDFTERFDFGHVITIVPPIPIKILEHLNYAYLYDLKLKLRGKGTPFIHLIDPLYSTLEPEDDEMARKLHSRSFRYLFYKPEEELEYEKVFKDFLLRNDAFLDGYYEKVYDPTDKYELMVSVVIPVLNRAKFIGTAIESVLNQDFDSYEILVVDNGSTDGSQDVVRKYISTGKVRLFQNPSGTISHALNTGIRNARGKYIAQLDSDDVYLPETLRCMVEALEKNPYAGLAISYYELMDEVGNPLKEFGVIRHLEYDRNNILRVEGAGAVRVWRKKVLFEMGLFDEENYGNYGEDYDMVLKVSEKYQVIRVHKVLYRYRKHPGSTDVTRPAWYRVFTKNMARQVAFKRRQLRNQVLRMSRGLKNA